MANSGPLYPDAMAMAGQNYQHFMELTKDVQKLSVVCAVATATADPLIRFFACFTSLCLIF